MQHQKHALYQAEIIILKKKEMNVGKTGDDRRSIWYERSENNNVHGKKILTKKAREFHMLIERERTVL